MNAVHAFVAREALGKTTAAGVPFTADAESVNDVARTVLQPVDCNPLLVRAVQVCAGGTTPLRRAV